MYNVYVYCYIYIVYNVYTAVCSSFCVKYLLFEDLYTLLPLLLLPLYNYYPYYNHYTNTLTQLPLPLYRLYTKEYITIAQDTEALSPLTLSELFRQSLCFIDEAIAEDPQPGTQLQMPHLKGQAVEQMLNTVYRRYCG